MVQKILWALITTAILSVMLISAAGCAENEGGTPVDVSKLTIKRIHVDDIDMAYKEVGSGYPLILIVGSGCTMDMWSPILISGLSKHFRVIIFDNRGIGATSSSDKEFTIKLFADDTAGLMDALKIEKANVLGWSMGAYIAQELVVNYPDKVNSLILYAADAGGSKAIHIPDTIAKLSDSSGSERERGERLLQLMFPASWFKANPDPRKYMPVPSTPILMDSIVRQNTAIERWPGTYERLSEINSPVLLVSGTDDVIAPPQNSIMMAGIIPDAWLVQVPGGGHGLMYQYPEKFLKITEFFFSIQ